MNKQLFSYIMIVVLAMPSCKKWVEVTPKIQVEDIELFSNEQGFKEALNGIYLNMGRPGQYGREYTFGLSDVLGGLYVLSTSNGSQLYRDARAGLYGNTNVQRLTDTIWRNQYNSIANVNKLIEELDRADSLLFSPGNYRIIKGEALGLRAFLHFDLLRFFGTAISAGGAGLPAIPYVKAYAPQVTGKSTHQQVLDAILTDLQQAADLLKGDPLYTGETITADRDNGYLMNRKLRFNYYAVRALQARVNLWAGKPADALPAAEELIGVADTKFPWITQTNIAASEINRDRVFSTEHIFGLFINDMALNYVNLLDTTRFTSTLVINSSRITEQFETSTIGAADYRRVYLIRELTNIASPKIFFGKLYQPIGIPADYAKKMPLIRIPEMYYIAAECLKETDPGRAVDYLNTVRASRGITATLSTSSTPDQIQAEIRKEYWKEFPSEGQFFFYLKRTNSGAVPGVTGTFPSDRYIIPLPPAELEFGY